ncbi:MAG TPA: hypothetical protein VIG69_11990 [Candidatus Methylomirabilis sp.]|jgi:flavin-dependent dehydrogenase
MRTMRVVIAGLLGAAVVVLGGTGWGSAEVFSDRLPGAPVYPPSDPAKIEIFRQIVPQRPYVSLGRIRVEPDSTIPREEVDRLLRAEAAKMGADAVLVETEGTRVVGVNYQQGGGFANLDAPQEVTAPLIIGAAIRYR